MSRVNSSEWLLFCRFVGALKRVKRSGWVRCGVENAESVAEHSMRMAVMAMTMPHEARIDVNRCVKMALVHDLAECIVGDITPHDGVRKEDKYNMEAQAMLEICGEGEGTLQEVRNLWQEYELGESDEAIVVKDLDKLEMILSAMEYEELQKKLKLGEFYESVEGKFKTEWVRKIAEKVFEERLLLSRANS